MFVLIYLLKHPMAFRSMALGSCEPTRDEVSLRGPFENIVCMIINGMAQQGEYCWSEAELDRDCPPSELEDQWFDNPYEDEHEHDWGLEGKGTMQSESLVAAEKGARGRILCSSRGVASGFRLELLDCGL